MQRLVAIIFYLISFSPHFFLNFTLFEELLYKLNLGVIQHHLKFKYVSVKMTGNAIGVDAKITLSPKIRCI